MPITNRLRIGCSLLTLIVLLGTIGFIVWEGWTAVDALYTTILVVSTLGFSDLRPTDVGGKLLTIFLIAAGVGTLYYLVGVVAQTLIEDQTSRQRIRQMEQQIARLRDHTIVCGFGRVGQQICIELSNEQCPFVVIDDDEARIGRIATRGYLYVRGDATRDEVLREAGVMRAARLLTAVATDAANVYITLSARSMNPNLFIVARAATAEAEGKLSIAGANRVISPYILGGRRMVGMALRPAVIEFLDVLIHSDDLEMWLEEVMVGMESSLAGVCLREAQLRESIGVTVLAVRRPDGRMLVNPPADTVLRVGDTLIVLGTRDHLRLITA